MDERLRAIASGDAEALIKAEKNYGSSWRKRGGVGAFMMLARKWDRLETALQPHPTHSTIANGSSEGVPCAPWDIFQAYELDQREEGIIDDIRDLRRYLLLVEEFVTRDVVSKERKPEPIGAERYPTHLTEFEYNSYGSRQIGVGSLKGLFIKELYREQRSGDKTVHPWVMHVVQQAEYGC